MIEWSKELEIGIDLIDDQHKMLIQTLDDLYDACRRGEGMKELSRIVKFLNWYLVKHFREEETIQKQYGFPNYVEHKKIHVEYLVEMARITKAFNADQNNIKHLSNVIAYLIKMIETHIKEEDIQLSLFIKQETLPPPTIGQVNIKRDYLTGLLSRKEFNIIFKQYLEEQLSQQTHHLYYIVMRLDKFEEVNKSYGYDIGDQVLIYVSGILHEYIAQNQKIARVHRDEFVMCVYTKEEPEAIREITQNIRNQIRYGFNRKGSRIPLSMSMGVVHVTEEMKTIKMIHQKAIIALGRSQETGINEEVWFESIMQEETMRRAKLLNMLQPYHLKKYLRIVYQPIYSLEQKRIKGAEALIRLEDSNGERISPGLFLDLAEQNDLMKDIGYLCIDAACCLLKEMNTISKAFYISVNLSMEQFMDLNLCNKVIEMTSAYNISPTKLYFEIIESSIIEDFDKAYTQIKALKTLGCKIMLDDFGTGYSALSYLSQVPIDVIKIDKSFLNDIETNLKAQKVFKAMIELAHSLEVEIVVEGVETREELHIIQHFKDVDIQGYLISKPIESDEMIQVIGQNKREGN